METPSPFLGVSNGKVGENFSLFLRGETVAVPLRFVGEGFNCWLERQRDIFLDDVSERE